MSARCPNQLALKQLDQLAPGDVVRPLGSTEVGFAIAFRNQQDRVRLIALDGRHRFNHIQVEHDQLCLPIATAEELLIDFDSSTSDTKAWNNPGALSLYENGAAFVYRFGMSGEAFVDLSNWKRLEPNEVPLMGGRFLTFPTWRLGKKGTHGEFEGIFQIDTTTT